MPPILTYLLNYYLTTSADSSQHGDVTVIILDLFNHRLKLVRWVRTPHMEQTISPQHCLFSPSEND